MDLSPELRRALEQMGIFKNEFESLRPETELLKDLGIDGDDFLEVVEVLAEEFGCDMSSFDFRRHCHEEADLLFPRSFVRWVKRKRGAKEEFEPVTIKMIDDTLKARKWVG